MAKALKNWANKFTKRSELFAALETSTKQLSKAKESTSLGHIMNWGGWFEPQDLENIKSANKSKNTWYIARQKMTPDEILKLLIPARIQHYLIELQCDGISDEGDAFESICGHVNGIVVKNGIDYLDIGGKLVQFDQIRNITIPEEKPSEND